MKTRSLAGFVCAAMTAGLVLWTVPAVAAPGSFAAALPAATAQAAQGDISETVSETVSEAEAAVSAAAAHEDTTTAPLAPTDSGVVINGVDVAFDGGADTSIDGELVVSEGTGLVYAADDLGGGTARLSAVIDHPGARPSWTFRGAKLQQFKGIDTISVVRGNKLVGLIEAPWAVDANGVEVPTHYEVRGRKLMQVVKTDADTAFPVVADPTVKRRWYGAGHIVYLTKNETLWVTGGVGSCAAVFSKSPHPVGKALSLGCAAIVPIAAAAIAQEKCLTFYVYGTGIAPQGAWYPWFRRC